MSGPDEQGEWERPRHTRSIAVASKSDPKSPSSVVNKISGRRVSRAAERTRQTVSIELRNLIYSCSYEIFFSLFFSPLPFFHSWSISLLYFSKLSTCVSRRDGVECQRKRTVAIRLTSSSPEAKHGVYWTHAQTHERWDSCRCKRQCCRSKEKTSEEKICLFFLRYYISVTERRKRKQREKKQSRKLPECRWILIKMCCCPLVFLCSTVSKLVDYEHCVLVGFRRNSRAVTLFRGSCRSWRVQPAQPYHNDRSITEIFTRKLYLSFAFLLCFAPIFHLLSPLHCLFVSITMSSFVFDVAKGRGSEWNRWAKQLVADRFVYALLLSDPFLSFQILL